MGDIPSEIDCRVLLVDELSDTLMYILGSCLHITPEFFEEHLLNSGWHENSYEDRETDMWSTRNLAKNYASIRWHRPIKQRVTRPFEEQASDDLLSPSTTPDNWEESSSPRKRILHSTEPAVNVLRRPWEVGSRSGGFSAWEERATVWQTTVGNCAIVLVLLDPLPIVRHRVRILGPTVVIRRRPAASHAEETEYITEGQEPEDDASFRSQVSDFIFSGITRRTSNDFDLRNLRRNRISITPEIEPHVEERLQGSPAPTVPEDNQPENLWENLYMFVGSLTRSPVLDYADLFSPGKDYLLHGGSLHESTASALVELVCSNSAQAVDAGAKCAPLGYLLMIILQDTLTVLRSMDLTLTEMNDSMLDEKLLQSNIDLWRRDLNRVESELRHLETSIPEFAQYIAESAPGKGTTNRTRLLSQCRLHIAKNQERGRTTYGSLMTAMSLVESKRGISEAESVTKLTELAFFFIPLTFAASLFSMQVKELDTNTTSISVFFAVALTITVSSYALRLVIRSSVFLGFIRRWRKKIQTSTDTPSAAPIATTTVLKWLWYRISPYMLPVCFIIPTTALLAALWTRSLQEGIKVGVTIALALLFLVALLPMVLLRWGINNKWARMLAR
ncbi:MAG: hypothetical protein Q9178_004482 [Gyalolechia marmorata]